jgi:RNA polymerase sigma-70 factor (ECF subfamily)
MTSAFPSSVNRPFDSLVRDIRPQVVRFLSKIVGETEAEDVTQAVLARAAVALPAFRGDASPRTWIFRIATNAARDWLRAHTRPELESIDAAGEEPVAPYEDSQERRLLREEMSQCVEEFLHRLPESYQTVLALSDCEELSDREIASILGMTMGATKIRLYRARTRLRKELERGCSFYRDDQSVLCCDRKEATTQTAYRSDKSTRLEGGNQEISGPANNLNEEQTMTAVEILPAKQKALIGVGAAIVAGCQPCTLNFVAASHKAGACDRGIRFAVESGLAGRQQATQTMASFASEKLAQPELDAAFRAERAMLDALIGVAAAIAGNTAALVKASVDSARARGATDDQIRMAAETARLAKRGAEGEVDNALAVSLGGVSGPGCCAERPAASNSACGCGCSDMPKQ